MADTEERTQFPSSGYNPKWRYADVEETNCWIKSYFYFLCIQKYSCSFVKLRLNPWCHMDYFTDLLEPRFWTLIVWGSLLSMRALGVHQKYINLCSEDERRSHGFRTTWGWIIYDRIFIFGWTIPLIFIFFIYIIFFIAYFSTSN